uniref:Spindle pole body component n=1 Tax=Amorphochlora amoebiformis TaxID=1561963 RepID=A0A7S0H3Y5_9EUKA|mmetsp:Transcript_8445/g.13235  ORF Transcript_8445/g.13235 Transcript_8445/m.13235 type:complete len:1863 (+) Transcript_8445:93-5681(+)
MVDAKNSILSLLHSLEEHINKQSSQSRRNDLPKLPIRSLSKLLEFTSKYNHIDKTPKFQTRVRPRLSSISFILRMHDQKALADALELLTAKFEELSSKTQYGVTGDSTTWLVLFVLTELAGTGGPTEVTRADRLRLAGRLKESKAEILKAEKADAPIKEGKENKHPKPAKLDSNSSSFFWGIDLSSLSAAPNPYRVLEPLQIKSKDFNASIARIPGANDVAAKAAEPPEVYSPPQLRSKFAQKRLLNMALGLLLPSTMENTSHSNWLDSILSGRQSGSTHIPLAVNTKLSIASSAKERWGGVPGFLPKLAGLKSKETDEKGIFHTSTTYAPSAVCRLLSDICDLRKSWHTFYKTRKKSLHLSRNNEDQPPRGDWDGSILCPRGASSRPASDFDVVYSLFLQHLHSPPAFTATEPEVSRLALAAMQGIPSSVFPLLTNPKTEHDRDDHSIERVEYPPIALAPAPCRVKSCGINTLQAVLSRMGRLGTTYRLLVCFAEHFSSAPIGGLVLHSFAKGVRLFLTLYRKQLLDLPTNAKKRRDTYHKLSKSTPKSDESCCYLDGSSAANPGGVKGPRVPSLLEVEAHAETLRGQLSWLANICQCDDLDVSEESFVDLFMARIATFPRGGALLSYLFECGTLSGGLKGTEPLFQFLFDRALEPYLRMLRAWIYKGQLEDPFNEFMIGVNPPNSTSRAEVPIFGYARGGGIGKIELREEQIPVFLQDVAWQIFTCGHTVRIVKRSGSNSHLTVCQQPSSGAILLKLCLTASEAQALRSYRRAHLAEKLGILEELTRHLERKERLHRNQRAAAFAQTGARIRRTQREKIERAKTEAESEARVRREKLRQIEAEIELKEERMREAKEAAERREAAFRRRQSDKRKERVKALKKQLEEKHRQHLFALDLQRQRLLFRKKRLKNTQKRMELIVATEVDYEMELSEPKRVTSYEDEKHEPHPLRAWRRTLTPTDSFSTLWQERKDRKKKFLIPKPTPKFFKSPKSRSSATPELKSRPNPIPMSVRGLSSGGGKSNLSLAHSETFQESKISSGRGGTGQSSGGGKSTLSLSHPQSPVEIPSKAKLTGHGGTGASIGGGKSSVQLEHVCTSEGAKQHKARTTGRRHSGASFGGGASQVPIRMDSKDINGKSVSPPDAGGDEKILNNDSSTRINPSTTRLREQKKKQYTEPSSTPLLPTRHPLDRNPQAVRSVRRLRPHRAARSTRHTSGSKRGRRSGSGRSFGGGRSSISLSWHVKTPRATPTIPPPQPTPNAQLGARGSNISKKSRKVSCGYLGVGDVVGTPRPVDYDANLYARSKDGTLAATLGKTGRLVLMDGETGSLLLTKTLRPHIGSTATRITFSSSQYMLLIFANQRSQLGVTHTQLIYKFNLQTRTLEPSSSTMKRVPVSDFETFAGDAVITVRLSFGTAHLLESKTSTWTPSEPAVALPERWKLVRPWNLEYLSLPKNLHYIIGEEEDPRMVSNAREGPITEDSAETWEAPLSLRLRTTFGHTLVEGIRLQFDLSNQALCHMLLHQFSLTKHLEALRKYLLMGAGDLMDNLARSLFDGMYADPPINWLSPSNLNVTLQSALRTCGYDTDPLAKNLSFALDSSVSLRHAKIQLGLQTMAAFDAVELHYNITWPASAVIDSASLQSYINVFKFLLKLKRLHYELRGIWTLMSLHKRALHAWRARSWSKSEGNDAKEARGNMHRWRLVEVFLMEMRHLVSNLEGYVMTQALSVPWARLQREITCACTLGDLRQAHARYISSAKARCFQSAETPKLRNHISKVFQRVVVFKNRMQALDYGNVDKSVSDAQFRALNKIMLETRGDCRLMFRIVRVLARRGLEPMRDLVTRLDYNRFFSKKLFDASTMTATEF